MHHNSAATLRRALWKSAHPLKLHLGCGSNYRRGWINIDLTNPCADYHLDMRRPFPVPSCTIEAIYSEHFVEHLSYPGDLEPFLAECFRVLRPGGVFEVGVPDAELALTAYASRDMEYFKHCKERWHPHWVVTPLDSINFTFRQGGEHQFAYDHETLTTRLRDAGFVDVRRRPWKAETDSPGWNRSLYIVARKPGAGIDK